MTDHNRNEVLYMKIDSKTNPLRKIRSGFEICRSTQSPCDLDRLIDIISRIHQYTIHCCGRPAFAELEHPGSRGMRGEEIFHKHLPFDGIAASPHGTAAEVGGRDGGGLRIITLGEGLAAEILISIFPCPAFGEGDGTDEAVLAFPVHGARISKNECLARGDIDVFQRSEAADALLVEPWGGRARRGRDVRRDLPRFEQFFAARVPCVIEETIPRAGDVPPKAEDVVSFRMLPDKFSRGQFCRAGFVLAMGMRLTGLIHIAGSDFLQVFAKDKRIVRHGVQGKAGLTQPSEGVFPRNPCAACDGAKDAVIAVFPLRIHILHFPIRFFYSLSIHQDPSLGYSIARMMDMKCHFMK